MLSVFNLYLMATELLQLSVLSSYHYDNFSLHQRSQTYFEARATLQDIT